MATGLFNLKQVNQAISQGAWSGYIAPKWVEYLVVAGGGSGGGYETGGGAGGLLTGIVTVAAGTSYTVTIGAGGTAPSTTTAVGGSGQDSVFGNITSKGGGGGGGLAPNTAGVAGGSGGGAQQNSTGPNVPGQGVSGQGNSGGLGSSDGATYTNGGGGGGAGTIGLFGTSSGGGNGGAGIASAISGAVTTYAGGGAGGADNASKNAGVGGVGGGGNGSKANNSSTAGGANTGGGGGGGDAATSYSKAGGSGIVVVRYPGSIQFFTGGTLSYANGYMIHTFYASGTLAPTTPTPYVTDYQISRSLRFNSADSAYLSRTPASATNQKTWTWSAWVKRSALGSFQSLFGAPSSSLAEVIAFSATDQIVFYSDALAAGGMVRASTAVYRDPSAWYHVVVSLDTTSATAQNRCRIWINGSEITTWDTNATITQNANGYIDSTATHYLGRNPASATQYLNAYMTEVNFIDGQALTPSSFGYTNPATGVWSPLAFVGTYGTNGFYLNFSDNSNTTAATLGKDYSGNGNNWTPNNFSVTAGAGNDSLVDSPTSYGTDTGVGGTVRGNYSTMNPLSSTSAFTLTDGNLYVFDSGASAPVLLGTIAVSSGKWYWEVTLGGNMSYVGFADVTSRSSVAFLGATTGQAMYNVGNVALSYVNGSTYNYSTASTATTNDVIGVALDFDTNTVTFYKNGTSQGTFSSGLLTGNTIAPAYKSNGSNTVGTFNFGQRPFAYTAPSGFKALNTQNLPTPTIGATSATLAGNYFGVNTYTGTGVSQTIMNSGFQPDWVWTKSRSSGSLFNNLMDSVRGTSKLLYSNSTSAEETNAQIYTAITSNGFTVGTDNSANQSGQTFVAWQWRASNATAVTNTSGSITSTVSANTTSGFSIVTYSGQSAAGTIGHGLGVAPSWIIVKNRSSASPGAWTVYSSVLGNTSLMFMNTTDAVYTGNTAWNSTSPTSSVFSVGPSSLSVNTVGNNFVAYCFTPIAGFSAFGSYTGNGSGDGPFVYCGFRPAWVMIKNTTTAGVNWNILDVSRDPYNVEQKLLSANTSNAEDTYDTLDGLSNGFKIRQGLTYVNKSGDTYIFAAFAQNPFKYSLAR